VFGCARRRHDREQPTDAARGAASAKNRRTRDKAEVFEDALARVSRRLATLARQQADELRAERLPRATSERLDRAASSPSAAVASTTGATAAHRQQRTPVRKKQAASTKAAGGRREATRDSR
jgi:hypothetical protein